MIGSCCYNDENKRQQNGYCCHRRASLAIIGVTFMLFVIIS